MFQSYIKGFGLKGDGSGLAGSFPYQLTLRVVGVAEASPKNIWINDYDTVAHAKSDADTLFAGLGASTETWTDSFIAGSGGAILESLSNTFSPTFGTGTGRGGLVYDVKKRSTFNPGPGTGINSRPEYDLNHKTTIGPNGTTFNANPGTVNDPNYRGNVNYPGNPGNPDGPNGPNYRGGGSGPYGVNDPTYPQNPNVSVFPTKPNLPDSNYNKN
jgi:hypothetical protein